MGRARALPHPGPRAPAAGRLWSCLLVLFIGGFSQLFTYVIFGDGSSTRSPSRASCVLRHKSPHLERPFRVPGYPWVPLVFVLAAAALVTNTLVASPRESSIGPRVHRARRFPSTS
jgi:amino acid transporter